MLTRSRPEQTVTVRVSSGPVPWDSNSAARRGSCKQKTHAVTACDCAVTEIFSIVNLQAYFMQVRVHVQYTYRMFVCMHSILDARIHVQCTLYKCVYMYSAPDTSAVYQIQARIHDCI